MYRILILLSLICLITHSGFSQDRQEGILTLEDNTELSGEFAIQSFGTEEVIRHRKPGGGQNTFGVQYVQKLFLLNSKGNRTYKKLTFDHEKYSSNPAVLFEVLYESDSIKLFRTDAKNVERFVNVTPLPGLLVVRWGKRLKTFDVLMMSDSNLENLTVINKPSKYNDYGEVTIDKKVVFDQFLTKHDQELKGYMKTNKLYWYRLDHFISSIGYYDSLLYK